MNDVVSTPSRNSTGSIDDATPKQKNPSKRRPGFGGRLSTAGRSLSVTLVAILGILWLAPLYLVVANAMKPSTEFQPSRVWVPTADFDLLQNIIEAWNRSGFGTGAISSALYSVVAPTLVVLIGAAAGFGIVALRLRRPLFWFMIIFTGTVFPMQMMLMPLFVGYAKTGLFDTRVGMILVYTVVGVPFATLLMRNFFTGIGRSVFEAAVIDGASSWRIFWQVYLPMSANALVAIFILHATGVWNEFLLGVVLTQSDARPVMAALAGLQHEYAGTPPPIVLAAAIVASVPTIAVFLAAQRYFRQGLTLTPH